jgi:hypothetical protein
MASPKPRRPRAGRGLPPARRSPEEEAEDARLRVELWRACERLDAIIARRREREEQGLDVFFARPR